MADSYVQTPADGNTATFTVPFAYLRMQDVQVTLNGIPQLLGLNYQWTTAGAITFMVTPPKGVIVTLQRSTSPDAALVNYKNGAVLAATDLNTATLQNFYRTQEIQDQLIQYITGGINVFNAGVLTAGMTAQQMIDAVAAGILQSDLAQTLQQNIGDITTNSETIAGVNQYINQLQTYQTVGLLETLALLGTVTNNGTAFVLNTETTQVGGGTTLAQQISQLQTAINGNTASIQTNATTVDGLSAQYTVKVDVNGHVAGFGLASETINGTVKSTFIIDANAFAVIDTSNGMSTPVTPFLVENGVVYMENVVIAGALIANASITTAQIANAAITNALIANQSVTNAHIVNGTITQANLGNAIIGTAQIQNAAITSAKIGNAQIGSAQIADLSVQSAHIANLAVGTTQVANNAITDSAQVTSNTTDTSFNYVSNGGVLVIQAAINPLGGTGGQYTTTLSVDGVVVDTATYAQPSRSNMVAIQSPAAGTHAISCSVSGGGVISTKTLLFLVEYKK